MEHTEDELEQSIEETRQEIEEKRAEISEKLELLEEKFRDTLEETRSTVEGIVENVKETVDDTVDVVKGTVEEAKSTVDNLVENVKGTMDDTATMVKKTFDLNYQVEQRPWLMFGGSILLGCMLAKWMSSESSNQREFFERGYHYDDDDVMSAAPMSSRASRDDFEDKTNVSKSRREETANTSYSKSGRWSIFTEQFQEEWDALKGVAIGTLMGTLRAMIRQQIPSIAPKLEQAINSASAKLGAEPIDFSDTQQQTHGHNGHDQSREPNTADWQRVQGSTPTGSPGSQPR
jgi:hypothetical protein